MSAFDLAVLAGPVSKATSSLAWTAAGLAWVLAVPLFYLTKYLAVVPHEGGHALIAKLLFQKLDSIRFKRSGDGVTKFARNLPWVADVPVTLAGYLGPSLFGLLAAEVLTRGGTTVVLWGSLVFLVIMLIAVRGLVGWLVVPGLMVVIGYVALKVPQPHQTLVTYVWVWFLLIVPVEHMFFFLRNKHYDNSSSDSGQMERLTRFPSALWALVFLAGTIAALAYGGSLLLRPA